MGASPHNSRTTPAVPRIPGVQGAPRAPAHGCSPDTSSELLCDGKVRRGTFWSPVPPRTVAVVGLPRPDEKSLAGTSCISATRNIGVTAHSSLHEIHVFRLGVRELSGLAWVKQGALESEHHEEHRRLIRRPHAGRHVSGKTV